MVGAVIFLVSGMKVCVSRRYVHSVQKDGVMNQLNNPEVEVEVHKADSMITRQLVQLRLITNRLEIAYRGEDVDWIDTGEFFDTFCNAVRGHGQQCV